MSSLPVTSFKNGTFFKDNGDPYEVIKYEHQKIGRGGASIKLKARNLRTHGVFDKTYPSGSKIEEAEISKKKVQFLYSDPSGANFMDMDTYEQFEVGVSRIEHELNFLKEGQEAFLLDFENQVIGIIVPGSVSLAVTETGPSERGDSTGSVTKPATLETGYVVQVPMFIKEGDLVKIDTRNGTYSERVKQ